MNDRQRFLSIAGFERPGDPYDFPEERPGCRHVALPHAAAAITAASRLSCAAPGRWPPTAENDTLTGMNKLGYLFAALMTLVLAGPALPASAASYDSLLPLLLDLPGWDAEPADGADASVQGMRTVTVYRNYESGDRRFEVNLLLGTQAGMTWMPNYQEGFRIETPEGLMEVKRIAGFLLYYTFEQASNSGGMVVLIKEAAPSNPNTGAVFTISFEGLPLDEALNTAQLFNWAEMKEQVAKLK
jgi:hypothetical protein